jgi:hypothetical protein
VQDQVIKLLEEGDRNPSELKMLLDCEYPQLFTVLNRLQISGEVECYFQHAPSGVSLFPWESSPHPVLTYSLKKCCET